MTPPKAKQRPEEERLVVWLDRTRMENLYEETQTGRITYALELRKDLVSNVEALLCAHQALKDELERVKASAERMAELLRLRRGNLCREWPTFTRNEEEALSAHEGGR